MRVLRAICISYAVVVTALGVSIYWNVTEAEAAKVRGQELYRIGLRDGEIYTRMMIRRAELEEQIIADANREKL